MPASIMIVEDDPVQRHMLETMLRRKLGYESVSAENGRDAIDFLERNTIRDIRLAILDLQMPVMDGMETLSILRQKYPSLPVIMLSGNRDIDMVVEAIKLGATDFLSKPFDGDRLKVTVENALKLNALNSEVNFLRREKGGQIRFENLIGYDMGLTQCIGIARKAASSDIQVLITGETGTGKEVLAKAIHGESERSGNPFIAVNCGAIPAQLIESTLFGHEKGSFTGAIGKSLGKFREAEGGTIFLDEIGDLPMDAQVKLLRVLQQKEVEPIGAGKAIPVNVRILSATHQDLKKSVTEEKFREDLYFRLNVLQIEIPPLRNRKQDIPLLVRYFINRFCSAEQQISKNISKAADNFLINYDWPGNIRQLENTIHRAIVMNDTGTLEPEDFSVFIHDHTESPPTSRHDYAIIPVRSDGSFKTPEEIELELMQLALKKFDGNITQAAKAIGMAKSTFYKKMKL